MNRIFGSSGPKKPPPNLTDVAGNLDTRMGAYEKKVDDLNTQLSKVTAEMKKYKPGSASYNALKQKALNLMKQKKTYEVHCDNLRNQAFNISQAEMSIQTLKDTKETVSAMQIGVKQFKQEYKKIDINKIDNVIDDLEEMMDQANDIQRELSRGIGMDTTSDFDLEAELDDLVAEQGLDSSYLDDAIGAPSVPSALPGDSIPAPTPAGGSTINGVAVDEFGLPQLPQ